MKPIDFVKSLTVLDFQNVFNPYSNKCDIHDLDDAPKLRSKILLAMLEAASDIEIDAIWIGRDLGYRGGRRTGLALTDDVHILEHAKRWGVTIERPTKGPPVAERTAAVIWTVLSQIEAPVFLWNVFPLHPHEYGEPFSNRSHNIQEQKAGEELLAQLILLLNPKRLVAIGNDAAKTVNRLTPNLKIHKVRHPSYGGQTQFLKQILTCYPEAVSRSRSQSISGIGGGCRGP